MSDFVDTMLYRKESEADVPWHGYGNPIAADSPALTNTDLALQEAGVDWDVEKVGLQTINGEPIDSDVVVRRRDTGSFLGVVGAKQELVQNRDALRKFQPLLDTGKAKFETVGSLKEGRTIFALAKIEGSETPILGADTVRTYLLFSHSHDGSLAVRMQSTDVRVVCWNTLSAAVRAGRNQRGVIGKTDGFYGRHTKNIHARLDKAHEAIVEALTGAEKRVQYYKALAQAAMDDTTLRAYARQVLFGKESEGEEDSTRSKNIVERVVDLAHTGRGTDLPGVRGTAWGGFNAVTEYLSHEYGRSAENRLYSQWYGVGQKMTDRAYTLAGEFSGLMARKVGGQDFQTLMAQPTRT